MPTGKTSGVDVLDIDSARHAEAISWWMRIGNVFLIPAFIKQAAAACTLFSSTTSLPAPETKDRQGIDVKANGGYIVWWPSYGRRVSCDAPINEWPDWLIVKQQPKVPPSSFPRSGVSRDLDPVAKFVEALQEGSRNNGTFWAFCRAYETVNAGLISEPEAVSIITQAALHTGLGEREVRAVARSAKLRAGRRNGY